MLSPTQKSGHRQSRRNWILNYLPGLVILIFGMLALHCSLRLMSGYQDLIGLYHDENALNMAQVREIGGAIKIREIWLYWSVMIMSLSGFVLILLNSDKLNKLKAADKDKKVTVKLLEDRLVAMESTYDGIGIVDHDGNLLYMNKALRDLHGITPDEAQKYLGASWTCLYSEKGREDIKNKVMPVLNSEGYWRGESPLVRKNGEIAIAELSLTRLPDGGFIGTAHDITEKKKAEKEQQELESRFYQAQKMEAVGRLAGGIAHDFNNILAAMNGYAEFLIEDLKESTPQHKFAINILKAGQQASGLVDQILAFSRHKTNVAQPMDIMTPVQDSLAMLSASLPKNIEVQTDFNIDSAVIDGNASQIAQVIMNLCVNARDAMDDENGTLKIALRDADITYYDQLGLVKDSLPDPKNTPLITIEDLGPGTTRLIFNRFSRTKRYITLTISDTGTGMSRTIMEHIFEPFFTTKPVDQGTGLGLSTVHGVMTDHQAVMIVESGIGRGTVFDLFFPISDAAPQTQSSSVQGRGEVNTGHILLVEDQPEVSEMMCDMLKRIGYDPVCVSNGLEALDIIREKPGYFDLIITDHNMPKMTGLELVNQVHCDFPDLPFIIVSGYSQNQLQDYMQGHAAIKAVLRKPVTRTVMAQTISAAIKSAPRATSKKHSA